MIRAVVRSAERRGWEVFGIKDGYDGLFETNGIVQLDRSSVRGITHLGGTIIGTTNRGDPLNWKILDEEGSISVIDRSQEVIDALASHEIDALIAVGGDGSLSIAQALFERGLNVIGVPKTIDNDLAATNLTFGFLTAVETATDAIDKLHSTAEAHERVMVVELMGRNAGWIALSAGVAATADVILIPEIPYDIERVCEKIQERYTEGRNFAIVVVAEGAFPVGGEPLFRRQGGGKQHLGGIGALLAEEIAETTGQETRHLDLGHLQTGGRPNAQDPKLARSFGAAAVDLVAEGRFGCMVALDPPDVLAVPLAEAIAETKNVPITSDILKTARALGTCMGD